MMPLPKVCLTLTAPTIAEDIALARKYATLADIVELRADRLAPDETAGIASFPAAAGIPAILTVRRVRDGGAWPDADDASRTKLLEALPAFAYVDLESDFASPQLERLAASSGTRVIRSAHRFNGFDKSEAASIDSICRSSDEIPKLAFMPQSLGDIADFQRIASTLPKRDRIFCAMGPLGAVTRIIPGAFGSFLTFASPPEALASMAGIGHIDIVRLHEVFRIRNISPATRLCGVTGWPLAVTSSPELHRRMCDRDGIDSVMIPLPSRDIGETVALAELLGFKGLAVTVPHKEALLPLLDEISPEAAAIGAANTVVWRGGRRIGHNTDIGGFAKAIADFARRGDLAGMRAAMIGSGGAARGVACALSRLGASVSIYARNAAKAHEIASLFGFAEHPLSEIGGAGPFDLVVQCTSVGNGSERKEDDPAPDFRFTGRELVYDLVYKPPVTPFLARARDAGCRIQSGMSMLEAQAEIQHRLMHADVLSGCSGGSNAVE